MYLFIIVIILEKHELILCTNPGTTNDGFTKEVEPASRLSYTICVDNNDPFPTDSVSDTFCRYG